MPSMIDLLNQREQKSRMVDLLGQRVQEQAYDFEPYEAAMPYIGAVGTAETKYGIPKNLFARMIDTESRYNPKAVSPKGAIGIAQIMPGEHPDVDPTDPMASIDYGARYLRGLYNYFGSWDKAVAAYNTGPGNVEKLGMNRLPEETVGYMERVGVREKPISSKSMLDLLGAKEGPQVPTTMPPAKPGTDATADFYRTMTPPIPFQGLTVPAMTPEVAAYMGRRGYGPKPAGGWNEFGEPLDAHGNPYYRPQAATGIIAETLQGLTGLVANPYETTKGVMDFILSIPAFLTGMVGAAGAVGRKMIEGGAKAYFDENYILRFGDVTLLDLYNAGAEAMKESFEFFEPGKEALLGAPTKESALPAQIAMAPLTVATYAADKLASINAFKDYPNIQGAIKIYGSGLGLLVNGMALHRGRQTYFVSNVKKIVEDAAKLDQMQKILDESPDVVLKQANQIALDAKKAQLELVAKQLADEVSGDMVLREQLDALVEAQAKKKLRPTAYTGIKGRSAAQVRAVMEKIPGDTVADYIYASKSDVIYTKVGDTWYDKDGVPIVNKAIIKAAEKGKLKIGEKAPKPELAPDIKDESEYLEEDQYIEPVEPKPKPKPEPPPEKRREVPYKDIKPEAQEVFDILNMPEQFRDRLRRKKKIRVIEHDIAPGENVKIPATWHDAVFRYTAMRTPEGNLIPGEAGSYDSIMLKGHVAGAKEGPFPPGHTLYIFDTGGSGTVAETNTLRIYRMRPTEPTKVGPKQIDYFAEEEIPPSGGEAATLKRDLELIKAIEDHYGKKISEISDDEIETFFIGEEVTDVDVQTGEQVPGLSTIFSQSKEKTELNRQLFEERAKSVAEDPNLFLQKLINDVNRWYHGEDIPIDQVRSALRRLATEAGEERYRREFLSGSDHYVWKEAVEDASVWASKLDRLKIEPSGIDLGAMIPLEEIPKVVRDILDKIRKAHEGAIRGFDLYRNKKLFLDTGFWMGRDGMWRYELDDSKANIDSEALFSTEATVVNNYYSTPRPLPEVYDHPDLYKAVPEMKDVHIVYDGRIKMSEGNYHPATKLITVGSSNKSLLGHEVQHAINHIKESDFLGSSPSTERSKAEMKIVLDRLGELINYAKTPELKQQALDTITGLSRNLADGKISHNQLSMFFEAVKGYYEKGDISVEHKNNLLRPADLGKPFERYQLDPGEMEARVASERIYMPNESRKTSPPWETLDRMLIDEGYPVEAGEKLYSGISPKELIKTSKAFKRWFGKSVIDKIVYHGTPFRFSTFDPNKRYTGIGIHFGTKEQAVSRLNEMLKREIDFEGKVSKARMLSGYLKMENPLRFSHDPGVWDIATVVQQIFADNLEGKFPKTMERIIEIRDKYDAGEMNQYPADRMLEKLIQEEGFDGIIYPNKVEGVGDSYVVFNSNQFKSAKNIGTFGDTDNVFYSGVPAKEIMASARKVADYTKKARGMKAFKPKEAAKMTRDEVIAAMLDRSGNIRREMLDKLDDDGYRTVQKLVLTRGSSSLAAHNLRQMAKEVYSGKSADIKKIQDDVILAQRMMDIGSYKTPKQFKFPKDVTLEDFARYRNSYRYKEVNGIRDLTAEEIMSIESGQESYFNWMKKALEDLRDNDLISEKEYDDLVVHNYRKIKLVDIFDNTYRSKLGKKPITVYDSGVETLARGRDTDIYEPSSEIMALEVFNRTYGRILNNRANLELLDLARKDPTNPFVRFKASKKDVIPSGWNRIYVFERGERKAIYLSPEMSKEWINTSPDISYRMGMLLRWMSGSPLLRTMATGINWGFALANLPRDILHIWYAARMFRNGKWIPIYSSHAPIYMYQMGRDLASVFLDVKNRTGKLDNYIEDGGGMEFLVHQGRLLRRGRHIKGPLDKFYDFMGYFGETSELLTRVAIRERMMRKLAKREGITMEEAEKRQDLRDEATFVARDYMDFGQGGWATKAADNAFPYLNAGIQGFRGFARAVKENPVRTMYKLAQFGSIIVGSYVAMNKQNPETAKALVGNVDMQNYLCIPLGDQFGFEDQEGQMRYPYLKLPLDPSQKFFKVFLEAATDKWLGNEIDVDRVVDSLKEFSPVGVTEMPPTMSAVLGYITNKDFWLNEDIWRKTDKPFTYPESKEEYIPGVTPEFYKDLGEKTGLSPERTRYAIEELVTSGTIWSYLLGKGYEAAFGDMPKEMKEQHLAEILSKTPIIKRFFGITNPYSQHAATIDAAKQASDLDRWIQNRDLDSLVQGYLFKGNVEKKQIREYIRQFKDMDVQERLLERFVFQQKTKDLSNRSFWLRLQGLTTEARAKVFWHRWESLSQSEKDSIRKEMAVVSNAGGVITPGFWEEVGKLRRQALSSSQSPLP